jgi:hypothetical protein
VIGGGAMTGSSLERRLRKLEGRRSARVAFYLAWGRTKDEADGALRRAQDAGIVSARGEAAVLIWPDPSPVPPSRWIALGGGRECPVAGRESEILRGGIRAELDRRAAGHTAMTGTHA